MRVLTRLIEREHEAHTALGDAASLIGSYDVKAEERSHPRGAGKGERVRRRGEKHRRRGRAGGLDAFFAELRHREHACRHCRRCDGARASTPDDLTFVDEALHAAFHDRRTPPEQRRSNGRCTSTFDRRAGAAGGSAPTPAGAAAVISAASAG